MHGLTTEQIELINAHGPYNSGAWRSGDVVVSNEDALAGRAAFVADTVKQAILERLTRDEIRTSSILDVGCYDGWVLEQGLADLPFARLVGAEPRHKNIVKGQRVRELLGLPTRAEYVQAGVEDLGDEEFDVVLCTGLLHHLESHGPAIRALRRICRTLLFVETLVLPNGYVTEALGDDLELKDVVYRYTPEAYGVTGQKLESSYYDGSADALMVVSIPSVETLAMHLRTGGFDDIRVIAGPDGYRADRSGGYRRWAAACVVATPTAPLAEDSWIADYELGMAATTLDRAIVEPLYQLVGSDDLAAAVAQVQSGSEPDDVHQAEILRNLHHNPDDKVALEYGKVLVADDPKAAITVLRGVTERLNADWRAVYRAHHALALAYEGLGEDAKALRHRQLCLTCNPSYPIEAQVVR